MPDEDIIYFMERYENNDFCLMFDELNVPFNLEELIKSVKQLNSNKSGGPDLYLNEFFIHGKGTLMPFILSLFNRIYELGYFPDSWSEGFVVPLHKNGSLKILYVL